MRAQSYGATRPYWSSFDPPLISSLRRSAPSWRPAGEVWAGLARLSAIAVSAHAKDCPSAHITFTPFTTGRGPTPDDDVLRGSPLCLGLRRNWNSQEHCQKRINWNPLSDLLFVAAKKTSSRVKISLFTFRTIQNLDYHCQQTDSSCLWGCKNIRFLLRKILKAEVEQLLNHSFKFSHSMAKITF